MEPRIQKDQYYLDMADTVLERSTCLRRKYGAVIVKNDEVLSTGYNGAPRGRKNCCDLGYCYREEHKIPSGERYELCRSVHAEANAIISASRRNMVGSVMYLAGRDAATNTPLDHVTSCSMCRRFIINAGITYVITRNASGAIYVLDVNEEWVESDDSIQDDPLVLSQGVAQRMIRDTDTKAGASLRGRYGGRSVVSVIKDQMK